MSEEVLEQQPIVENDTPNVEDEKEKNFKLLVAARKKDQEEYKKQLEINQKLEQENARKAQEVEDLKTAISSIMEKRYDLDDDEIKKEIQREADRIYSKKESERKKQLEKENEEKELRLIRETMPDLDEVCSTENLLYLEHYYPEIATPLSEMAPGYKKAKIAYDAVKKHVKMAKKEEKQIEKNLSKPKSVHSTLSNESQKEEPGYIMNDSRKREVWGKMQRLISGEEDD